MGFGLFVGFAASIFITSNIIKTEVAALYEMNAAHQAEVKRLRSEIRELELERAKLKLAQEKERAEAERTLFQGGLIAATIAGVAVVGPAVVDTLKQMR